MNITSSFLNASKAEQNENNTINILAALQALESFSINYGKIHYNPDESRVIHHELFGEYLIRIIGLNRPMKGNPVSGIQEIFACGIWNPEKSCLWNTESWDLESGMKLMGSGIPKTIGIPNPSYTENEWNPVSGIRNPRHEIHVPRLTWISLCGDETSYYFVICLLNLRMQVNNFGRPKIIRVKNGILSKLSVLTYHYFSMNLSTCPKQTRY